MRLHRRLLADGLFLWEFVSGLEVTVAHVLPVRLGLPGAVEGVVEGAVGVLEAELEALRLPRREWSKMPVLPARWRPYRCLDLELRFRN